MEEGNNLIFVINFSPTSSISSTSIPLILLCLRSRTNFTTGERKIWEEEGRRCDLLMMSEVPIDNTASSKQNEFGPNYFAYYKHLVLDLFSQNGDVSLPFTDGAVSIGNSSGGEAEGSHTDDKGRGINYCHDSSSYFTEAVGKGISEFKRERLLATLNESAACFNREADEVLEQILAAFQIDSSLRERGQFPNHWNSVLDKDLSMPFNNKKRKAHSSHSNYSGGNSTSVRQVYNSIQALQGKDEICHEDVEKYTFQLIAKIDKMEENLEEYMNIVTSKCRSKHSSRQIMHNPQTNDPY